MDWLVQHPTDQYTHAPKSAGYTFFNACAFFLSHQRVFYVHYFVKLPPVPKSYPGSHGTHSSPFRTTERAFVLIARNKMFRIGFPSLASPCVELVCIHATYQYHTQHAGCDSLSAVSLYTDAFVPDLDLDPNEHTSCLLIIYLWSIVTCSIVSISRYPEHILDIDIDIIIL